MKFTEAHRDRDRAECAAGSDVRSALPVCGADPSSAAAPGPDAPAAAAGSSASPRGRSWREERCAPSENTEHSPPAQRSSPDRADIT